MELTLLIDLDDTLLVNSIEAFQPAYLKALGKHLSAYFPADKMIRQLLVATERMIQNQDPGRTLEETFDQAFYPALGVKKEDLTAAIDAFYAEVFPTLRGLTRPKEEALRFVDHAVSKGYRLVIATAPLFPRTAIMQRLEWAGITPDRYPLSLVTTYENFHFTKPNPAYYAEILSQLGCPEGPIVMVGNSLSDDIAPAASLGLGTYWLSPDHILPPSGDTRPDRWGNLENLDNWLDQLAWDAFAPAPNTPAAIIAFLQATPAGLNTLTAALPARLWSQRPETEEWALAEIACHLRDVDSEVNLPRLEKVAQQDNPFLAGQDTDQWANERRYLEQDGRQALRDFNLARGRILILLRGLGDEGWKREARHALLGPTNLLELTSFMVSHDRTHIQQATRTLRQIERRS
jgi:FMN phosphatase YigB (HAD superfamily)